MVIVNCTTKLIFDVSARLVIEANLNISLLPIYGIVLFSGVMLYHHNSFVIAKFIFDVFLYCVAILKECVKLFH